MGDTSPSCTTTPPPLATQRHTLWTPLARDTSRPPSQASPSRETRHSAPCRVLTQSALNAPPHPGHGPTLNRGKTPGRNRPLLDEYSDLGRLVHSLQP
uniref:Uncharacterized protein n=1 Tax=Knipowitschia caucasica TaxID=637954 RepID=A0AAV2K6E2_KNICA